MFLVAREIANVRYTVAVPSKLTLQTVLSLLILLFITHLERFSILLNSKRTSDF